MVVEVHKTECKEVDRFRELYRHEANCQIIHDAGLSRGWADPYLITVDGRIGGYGAVYTQHYAGRVMEFYTFPQVRAHALPMFREFLSESKATQIEAQTNMPLALAMLLACGTNITPESILFADVSASNLALARGVFRRVTTHDRLASGAELDCDFVIEVDGQIASTGGYFCHYNPPYGDIYMETPEEFRRQGFASYLVQEMKRACYESGKKPSARCNPTNDASRRTLQRAGFAPVGHLLAADVSAQPSFD